VEHARCSFNTIYEQAVGVCLVEISDLAMDLGRGAHTRDDSNERKDYAGLSVPLGGSLTLLAKGHSTWTDMDRTGNAYSMEIQRPSTG
jgi:hypothetical protein